MEKKKNSRGIIILLIMIIIIMAVFIGLILTGKINLKTNNTTNNNIEAENNNFDINESNINNTTNNIENENSDFDTNKSNVNNTLIDDGSSSTSNEISQKSSVEKSQILSYYKEIISTYSDHLYSIADINNDNIPELFIYRTGTIGNEIVAYTSVHTYDENKGDKSKNYIIDVGIITGRYTELYKMNDGRLLSVYAHMGYEKTQYFTLENDWLIRNEFSYRQTDNYTSGDNLIEFIECSDTSLIDNYS